MWASDQSNSVPGQEKLGIKGSFLWIWDSDDIETQLAGGPDATPIGCEPGTTGPCDLIDLFPQDLVESTSGTQLKDLSGFGRLHGVIKDPQQRYVNANIFAPGGGYIGVIDTRTKEAVALFRATEFNGARSVHMSFWNKDGSAIIVGNLNGKAIERINVERDPDGIITQLSFDKSATLGLGKAQSVTADAAVFTGVNAHGNPLIGQTIGDYLNADLSDFTPNSVCKENGCDGGANDGDKGGRGANLPICSIPSMDNDLTYITLAGGGLFVVDASQTPLKIVGEYGKEVIYGAGCGGVQAKGKMHVNSGVSASGLGADQSMFAVWQLDDEDYLGPTMNPQNEPLPAVVFEDEDNTATGGNLVGVPSDPSGQIPGQTTRRDSHGTAATVDESYVHVVDRVQNVVESFDVESFKRVTYDLTSKSGKNGLTGQPGACAAKSVLDDENLPINDPAPDLSETTPDGKYLMIAFRGPAPVSVPHSAQGSCPGVGVVELLPNGKGGRLVGVLRSTNTVVDAVVITDASFPGGIAYSGAERSDVHGAIVVSKV